MLNWKDDKRWSDNFLPEIKSILGLYLIGEPGREEDAERNTDLIVLKMEAVRIACRVRKNYYLESYANQFTIRAGRPSGMKTELTKILEGWGDYFFYGFSDFEETKLEKWILGDLKVFRRWFCEHMARNQGAFPGISKGNHDNSSSFLAYDESDLPIEFFVASSEYGLFPKVRKTTFPYPPHPPYKRKVRT